MFHRLIWIVDTNLVHKRGNKKLGGDKKTYQDIKVLKCQG